MKNPTIVHWLFGLLMLAAAGMAIVMKPTQMLADKGPKINLETMIPKDFGDWKLDASIVPIAPNPQLEAAINKIYNQTLSRTYINRTGERIMLEIAYGGDQSDNLQVHLPEGCYRGQGFAVTDKVKGIMNTMAGAIPVARLVASKDNRNEPITYWIVVGNHAADDNWEMKKIKLAYALKGQVPDGMLVRISSIDADVKQAYNLQQNFASELLAALPADARARLMGING